VQCKDLPPESTSDQPARMSLHVRVECARTIHTIVRHRPDQRSIFFTINVLKHRHDYGAKPQQPLSYGQ
jgi:hypothetical protein